MYLKHPFDGVFIMKIYLIKTALSRCCFYITHFEERKITMEDEKNKTSGGIQSGKNCVSFKKNPRRIQIHLQKHTTLRYLERTGMTAMKKGAL